MANAKRDPKHHTQRLQKYFQELFAHLRSDIEKVDEPRLKAELETEVLMGLSKAFADYERKSEAAWRPQA
jgi:hypothetical protein